MSQLAMNAASARDELYPRSPTTVTNSASTREELPTLTRNIDKIRLSSRRALPRSPTTMTSSRSTRDEPCPCSPTTVTSSSCSPTTVMSFAYARQQHCPTTHHLLQSPAAHRL
ncbi:hypothetical protein Bca4012_038234 [Brassica carinata]|uniref:Uncharacterized protein n=1 Tax=Brassica carinata TaxID=52824 RepID=A0A8X7W8F3_BRACI|nr:hypothetical protein Bca52824_006621 [Brassica carinata]